MTDSVRLHPAEPPPVRMPSPFAVEDIAPAARRAALELVAAVDPAWGLDQPGGGKMFGVLVVRAPDGRLGTLRAFSGMLAGSWFVEGFVGPTFDAAERDAWWPAEEAALDHLDAVARSARSRVLLKRIHDGYRLANARGEVKALRDLFAPAEPPGGAGDCAAPKLLAHAYREGLTPLALAEIWVGAPPATGGRIHGSFYPACRGKCGPILTHMLLGLDVEPAPEYGTAPIPADEPRVIHEDTTILVVVKPIGLLSVPGRTGRLQDSVQTRLRARYPDATGPLVVHRLDLDTSGLILCAKDWDTYKVLQAQFARREITKHYTAWLDGPVPADSGTIDLPLRVDLDDRPRQLVDPVHGKRAITEWRVVRRADNRTLVELRPLTGRTHQLRVHCATGLGVPIVGDRLYGQPGPRLLLHAGSLAFTHPVTGAPVELSAPPTFPL